jgi:mannose-6-phosphate isomerase
VSLSPSRLAPIFVPRIWGSRNLAPLFDSTPAVAEPIGEVWLTGDKCGFISGALSGRSLGEAWGGLSAEWKGLRLQTRPRIPLLVKFIFPEDKLSVQVHPNDEYASRHEAAAGGTGKTEMWYAVAARPNAELRLGLEPGVTPDLFRKALTDGTVEQCLTRFSVQPGDIFFVPAGSAHTIGPGVLLCEVQQHSDLTYRVFDYNRRQADGSSRPLHVPQALDVLQFGSQQCGKVRGVQIQREALQKTYLAACPYFASEIWEFAGAVAGKTCPDRFELLVVLGGHGRIHWRSESMPYNSGEAWMLPAALGDYDLAAQSATKLLRTYVPDLEQLSRELADNGLTESQRSAILRQ